MQPLPQAQFERLVGDAVDGLPKRFARALNNVQIVVEDGTDPHLLGLYVGIPLTERLSSYSAALPDKITIYRLAICSLCETEQQVLEQVRVTVIHEIGHHFGIDDDRLHELGW